MTTIKLPPDVENILAEEAQKRGVTPEWLAVDCLRERFSLQASSAQPGEHDTLFDFLSGYVGVVEGTTEPLSENCGQRFTQGLLEKQKRGCL